MSDERGHSGASVALAFILGGALGGCLALIMAPEPGRKTRERLRGLATEARERALDTAEDVRDRVEDLLDQGKSTLEEKKTAVSAAYQAGRDAFQRERERVTGS
jgi:gas vesicle protein